MIWRLALLVLEKEQILREDLSGKEVYIRGRRLDSVGVMSELFGAEETPMSAMKGVFEKTQRGHGPK
jgi:hypothetical protein